MPLSASGCYLLDRYSLLEARHRPLYVLSTGQLRKVQLAACLLSPPRLLLLDEALDGLDAASRREAIEAIARTNHEHKATLVMVAHRREDLPHTPTHALLLGQGSGAGGSGAGGSGAGGSGAGGTRGPTGTGWRAGEWKVMEAEVTALLESADSGDGGGFAQHEVGAPPITPPPPPPPPPPASKAAAVPTTTATSDEPRPVVEFDKVQIRYDCGARCFVPPLSWTVCEGENWAVVGGNGAGKTTLVDLISGECDCECDCDLIAI